jgi:2-dehydro-3-deoxygalactonokinase
VACPAGPEDLARASHHHVTATGRRIAFVTGLSYRAPDGMPEVMRSEEVQVFGALDQGCSRFVTPGTHSKWITVEAGRIVHYATYVTGEVFAALRNHTILGRLIVDGPPDDAAFARGVKGALADPAGFLHRIFAARSLALFGELPGTAIASYLSGQVIGSEVAHAAMATDRAAEHLVLASPVIGEAYVQAMRIAELKARLGNPAVIVNGLRRIAQAAGLL